ncbi:TraR/DksA C4-type zinc finger protein [Dactylosporangium aurantiacum]|uniref:TraR/DksA C4-type zinc finger protein n=1 Tax=Dactylosporangium aurantiacum TaxID=35754 RepID=A0A9Q9IAZ4_9ACTN|nr:TraR/DksA C4-type zinc finger protein [Dactylosporangium aurantiacum]MDG6106964.1 TraR/DksA C4-type zinc finger protein [Dactylosporangium aurantiacum]UWZ50677.1 TraR/DksA C4-type zinc finger protein [Dactylosporangium aurantiacum]
MDVDTAANTDTVRQTLQDQLRQHTETLAALVAAGADPDTAGEDPQAVAARTAAARQAIEETNAALARVAAGSYGRCERCAGPIPAERLEILPHARLCVPCHARGR